MNTDKTSLEAETQPSCLGAVMCSAFYEVYHKADNHYVVWCKMELMAIDLFIFPDGVDWQPYPYFQKTKFPFDEIEQAVRRHYT